MSLCELLIKFYTLIFKHFIGQPNHSIQKIRIKDKNQSNISIAEDDYEVAMGLLSHDDTHSDDESYNDFDETFVPSGHPAPPARGRSISLRSGRISVQTTISYETRNSLQRNRREENNEQRQTRAFRRQQIQQESLQQLTIESRESSLDTSQTSERSLRANNQNIDYNDNIDNNDFDKDEDTSIEVSENVSSNSPLSRYGIYFDQQI